MTTSIAATLKNVTLGNPQTVQNLALFPLLSAVDTAPDYVTLAEALKGSQVRVTEVSAGGVVPELLLDNASPKRVLLLDGDEFVGAKQNRVLNFTILVVIGTFTVRFLAIHPSQDGNGCISRVVTTLLLLRAGYEYAPFSSLERVIEENKDDYYRTLRRAQSTLDRGEKRLGEWLVFFLRCLGDQVKVLERKDRDPEDGAAVRCIPRHDKASRSRRSTRATLHTSAYRSRSSPRPRRRRWSRSASTATSTPILFLSLKQSAAVFALP
jgi:hypothetical protein